MCIHTNVVHVLRMQDNTTKCLTEKQESQDNQEIAQDELVKIESDLAHMHVAYQVAC